MTGLIGLAFVMGIAMLILSFILRIARKLLRFFGGLLCGVALIAGLLVWIFLSAM